jgi:type IV secretion system protein VirB10
MSAPHGSDETADPETVVGERGIRSINRARSLQSRVSNVLAIALMSALGLGLLGWYYGHTFSSLSQAKHAAQSASRSKAQGDMPLPSLGRIDPPAAQSLLGPAPAEPPPADTSAAWLTRAQAPPSAYGTSATGTKSPEELALERKLAGPAFSRSAEDRSTTTQPESSAAASSVTPQLLTENEHESGGASGTSQAAGLQGLLRPSVTPAVRAQILPTQRLLLPKGAFVDCTLETAIDSTLPGMTTCVTATDTFSADGSTVLMERGTKLVGETRGQVQQGSARVFVLWTEARTPTGVVIPLDSPGTDELGRSGLAGQVNRHFFERFGAAILITVIDGAVQRAAQPSNGGSTVIYNPSASQDIMTEVLKSTVNIAPTVTKNNGDRIEILVARDLDFRSVYELKSTARAR